MKITVVSGSHRETAQSLKVANFIKSILDAQAYCSECEVFSLSGNPLPLWDEGVWDGEERWMKLLTPLKEQMASSEAFVIISPEWHGQVPAGLKNFFLLMSKKELGHKPALIVSVSSGDGGAYPVAELRMSSYKNNRLCYIPEHVIVRHVEEVLNDDNSLNNVRSDAFYRERIPWALNILAEYAVAFRSIRASGVTESETFKNGM